MGDSNQPPISHEEALELCKQTPEETKVHYFLSYENIY